MQEYEQIKPCFRFWVYIVILWLALCSVLFPEPGHWANPSSLNFTVLRYYHQHYAPIEKIANKSLLCFTVVEYLDLSRTDPQQTENPGGGADIV